MILHLDRGYVERHLRSFLARNHGYHDPSRHSQYLLILREGKLEMFDELDEDCLDLHHATDKQSQLRSYVRESNIRETPPNTSSNTSAWE